jgi:hypothetical protein
MYVWVTEGDDRPDHFLGRVLLGIKATVRGIAGWEGQSWAWYDKSQRVRFVVNKPVGTTQEPLCESPGSLFRYVVRVNASVLDEPSPTFLVNSMEFALNLTHEVYFDDNQPGATAGTRLGVGMRKVPVLSEKVGCLWGSAGLLGLMSRHRQHARVDSPGVDGGGRRGPHGWPPPVVAAQRV